jgi:pseudouridine-5'-phosphate glycosidase
MGMNMYFKGNTYEVIESHTWHMIGAQKELVPVFFKKKSCKPNTVMMKIA